jgi:hypothetical protein
MSTGVVNAQLEAMVQLMEWSRHLRHTSLHCCS